MKKIIQLSIALIAITLITSCNKHRIKPSPQITTQTYALGGYDRVVIGSAITADVTFTTGTEQVSVEANANIHAYIITEVVSGTLYIRVKDHTSFVGPTHIQVSIFSNGFSNTDVSGASTLKFNNTWVASSMGIHLSGASTLSGDLNAGSVSMEISGASNIDVSGVSNYTNMDLSGASHLSSLTFATDNLIAELSGASSATLTVNQSLSLDLSGASSLRYAGAGTIDHISSSGGSTVEHI